MQPENWKRIELIFNQAVFLPEAERLVFVEEKSEGNNNVKETVVRLLANDSRENVFLDEPLFTLASQLITKTLDEDLLEKKNFAHYRLLKVIGRGGMGTVFLAFDALLGRRIALKVLSFSFDSNAETVSRFRLEARAASNVSHQGVAHVYEFGEFENCFYLAMEYVSGRTLREHIEEKLIDRSQAIDVACQIAAALQAAHKAGIIHRDIKPENIIVMEDGLIKVLDFGLAKLAPAENSEILNTSLETVPGLIMGTTAYMSPEQIRGQTVDQTTDIWSLGVVLYEMLAGKRPFEGETPSDIRAAILRDDPAIFLSKINLNSGLFAIIKKTLQKKQFRRYQTAMQLIQDLKNLKYSLADNDSDFTLSRSREDAKNLQNDANLQLNTYGGERNAEKYNLRAPENTRRRQKLSVAFGGSLFLIISFGTVYFSLTRLNEFSSRNAGESVVKSAVNASQNLEAEREYQTGRYIWNKRNAKDMPEALARFQKAIELDPGFAPAYAGLADAYMWDGNPNLTENEKLEHMRAAVQRALALDPNLAEAHTTYAVVFGKEWNWNEEIKEFEKAIKLNPDYPTAHHWYAETLAFLGRDDEAIEQINKALELDPLSFAILNDAITINWYTRRYEEAIKKAEKMTTFDKRYEAREHLWLSRLYFHIGNTERAKQEFKRYEQLDGKVSNSTYGNFYAFVGEREKALFYLKKIEDSKDNTKEAMTLAGSYADLDMREDAFKWLEIAFENRNPSIIALAANPDFDRLRLDPHYWNLLERMNLAEFWRSKLSHPE